jgi:hypothetical protein
LAARFASYSSRRTAPVARKHGVFPV